MNGGAGPTRAFAVSRRQLLVAATLTPILAACGRGNSSAGTSGRPTPTAPAAAIATRWDVDPWSLGSYSAMPVGTRPSVRRTLAEATLGSRVLLAGEYTAVDFPSTVHGAYLSGQRAASRLLSVIPTGTVAVIGAGIAGLAAAVRLRAAGRAVVVFDARDRVGGRISTDMTTGVPVELGAAWVHGVKGNPMTALIKQAGASLVPCDYEDEVVRGMASGAAVPGVGKTVDGLLAAVDKVANDDPALNSSAASAVAAEGWNPRPSQLTGFAWSTEIMQEYGLDPGVLGGQALSEGSETLPGGDSFIAGGYDKVPKMLATGLDVRLAMPVASVRVEGAEVVVSPQAGAPIRFAAAIVAVPVSLLQRGLPKLTPMPTEVQRALQGLATGNLEKVVLEFPARWWPNKQVLGVVGDPDDRWSGWFDISAVTGRPTLVGLTGGTAATTRPKDDSACINQARAAIDGAFRPRP